jgi:starch synthase
VASRCAGIPEIVQEGTTGLLFDVGDDEGLRRTIDTLLDDRDAAQRMGEAGRARVLGHYDAQGTTSKLVDVLRQASSLDPIDS